MSRRCDDEPETEEDRKFFDLRESGPIDQDGNRVDDVNAWARKTWTPR